VDCGGNASASAGDVAADHLAALGRDDLDWLVLTHLDDDHFNGVAQLLYRLDVKKIAAPRVERLEELVRLAGREDAELILVETKQVVAFGEAKLTLYPPLGRGTSNEEGLFVLCSAGDFDTLITGDADEFVERMLVKYYGLPDIELLMVGHHGSKNSTCQELLDVLCPELAVISVGYNSYGHPAQETLARLEASDAKIYRTDENGTVTIAVKDGMIAVK
jgi:competence protein ComEC